MKHPHSRVSRSGAQRKSGFTLVEIIVVLAIATLLSSIVFAAFKSIGDGNKKSSCQNNLVQVYQALRLYGQDFNGEYPLYNAHDVSATTGAVNGRPPAGLGLWALYAYPQQAPTGSNLDCDGRTTQLPPTEAADNNQPPLASYIKSPRFFHCPYDKFEKEVRIADSGCNAAAGTSLKTDVLTYTDTNNVERFNPFYNSYQTADDVPAAGSVRDLAPYSSFRNPGTRRQLVYYETGSPNNIINTERRTPDTTVVTWCRFHRKQDGAGLTRDGASLNNSDNVLFLDGTVRYMATRQAIGTANCEGWQRIPAETVDGYNTGANANTCPQ